MNFPPLRATTGSTNCGLPKRSYVPGIKCIPKKKTSGEYGIPLKNLQCDIPLTCYPIKWKTAGIITLLKPKKEPHSPERYRPISLLGKMRKVLQILLVHRIGNNLKDFGGSEIMISSDLYLEIQLFRIMDHGSRHHRLKEEPDKIHHKGVL